MERTPPPVHADERGFSITEAVVSVMLLSIVAMGIAGTMVVGSTHLKRAESDVAMWVAGTKVLEEVTSRGYDGISSGARTVDGYHVTWSVSGDAPKEVTVVVERTGADGVLAADTLVSRVADWSSL